MAYEGFTEYTAKNVLEHVVGKTAFAMPAAYVALYIGDPLGSGVEVSGTGYARVATVGTDWNAATFASPTASITNAVDIDFGAAGGDWGTVDYVALFDAATVGNMLASGDLAVARPVVSGDPVKFPASTLTIRYTQATI